MHTLSEITEYGALSIIFLLFVNYISKMLENKNKHELTNTKHNNEMFSLIKKQAEQNVEMNKMYQSGFCEMKKLILNSTNMGIEDFETMIKLIYQNTALIIEKEMISIIDRNHIDINSLDLTNRKVSNLIDKVVNDNLHLIGDLSFDASCVNEITDFFSFERGEIKKLMDEIVKNYANSIQENKKEEAIKQIQENIKYISNALESHLYISLTKFN